MNEKELAKQLEKEGFGHTYFWQDGPNVCYPKHIHATQTAHVILQGEMTLTCPPTLCILRGWGRWAAAI
jgi:hypothetical protein